MASVDVTITYDNELGTAADVGEVLARFASFDLLKVEKLTLEIFLPVGEEDAPVPDAMSFGLMRTLTDLPLGVKAGLKLTLSRDKYGAPDVVGRALRQIAESGEVLLSKIALNIPVRDELTADTLIGDLEVHLADRPMSVDVEFEKVVPGSFRRGKFDRRTPMDEAIRKAGGVLADFTQRHGVEKVTLTHRVPGEPDRTVELTPETRERATELLRRSITGE